MSSLITLKKRQDFIRLNQEGVKWIAPSLVIQGKENDFGCVRVGVTATRKIGKAVLRNRAKRRLRELIRQEHLHLKIFPADYVMIARPLVLTKSFSELVEEFKWTLKHIQRLLKKAS